MWRPGERRTQQKADRIDLMSAGGRHVGCCSQSAGRLEIVTKCYRGTAEEEEGGDRKLRGLFIHCPGDQIKDDVIG